MSQKSETVAENGDCRRFLAVLGDSLDSVDSGQQCGQGLTFLWTTQ